MTETVGGAVDGGRPSWMARIDWAAFRGHLLKGFGADLEVQTKNRILLLGSQSEDLS